MASYVDVIRDKSRAWLQRFSEVMGEATGIVPAAMYDRSLAQASVDIEMPSFKTLLPYESVDEDLIFHNRDSLGFGFELSPMPGADETLMKNLAELIKNKLPKGVYCSFMLYKSPFVADRLAPAYEPILQRGGIYAELAQMSLQYHLKAVKDGYKNARNVPAVLADYRVFLFVAQKKTPRAKAQLCALRDDFGSELKASGFGFVSMNLHAMTVLVKSIVSFNREAISWPTFDSQSDASMTEEMVDSSTVFQIDDKGMDISVLTNGVDSVHTRIVNLEISKWPSSGFALWQTPDLFANLLRPEQGILCPFIITLSFVGVDQERVKQKAKSRAGDLSSSNNGFQNFINPAHNDELKEWSFLHTHTAKGDLHVLPCHYNVMLFTSPEKEREQVAKAIASFRYCGFSLNPSRCMQWLNFLNALPFFAAEGHFEKLKMMGKTKLLSHYNIANMLPIVADTKGSSQGLLLPTYRHQAFFLDCFDDKSLPITNYNRLTVASSGAGKSMFEQAQILDGLSRGEIIFVIDLGGSYKNLCEMVGGTYIDASTMKMNPFTLFDFEGKETVGNDIVSNYIQICNLLSIMASPGRELDEVQKSWILEAIKRCWQNKGRQSCIDDVIRILQDMYQSSASSGDLRLLDLITNLSKYGLGENNIYGHIFNGETPLLTKSNFVVLELEKLKNDERLMTIVMYTMIIIIQGQFYQTGRALKKRCVIDEAWQFLTKTSSETEAGFIAQGFRTARKYNGGFVVITQSQYDTTLTAQGQAIAASSDTKVILRQGDFANFVKDNPSHFTPLQVEMIKNFGVASGQGFSNVMLQFGNSFSFHRYFADPFTRILFSTKGEEYAMIDALRSEGMSIGDAVRKTARHFYGEIL